MPRACRPPLPSDDVDLRLLWSAVVTSGRGASTISIRRAGARPGLTSTRASRTRRRSGTRARPRRVPRTPALRPRTRFPQPRSGTHPLPPGRQPGAHITLEFRNLDNVWNGQPGSVAGDSRPSPRRRWPDVDHRPDRGTCWRPRPRDADDAGETLYVARMQPYRLSRFERLLARPRRRMPRSRRSGRRYRGDRSRSSGSGIGNRKPETGNRYPAPGTGARRPSRLRPGAGTSVGIRQQLGRPGPDRAPAARRRGREALA